MEMLVVIVIIGILATLSVVHYGSTREKAYDGEAAANLIMLQSAQKIYQKERGLPTGTYYPSPTASENNMATINSELKVLLRQGASAPWNYTVFSSGCVSAGRVGGTRSWFLTISDADGKPDSGACP